MWRLISSWILWLMSFRLLLMGPLTSTMKKILHFKGQLLVLSLNYCMVNISDDGLIICQQTNKQLKTFLWGKKIKQTRSWERKAPAGSIHPLRKQYSSVLSCLFKQTLSAPECNKHSYCLTINTRLHQDEPHNINNITHKYRVGVGDGW